MDVSPTLWVLTVTGLAALIAIDFVIGRKPHEVSLKEAGTWTVVWIALAGLFGLGLFLFGGGRPPESSSPASSPRSPSASTTSSSSS
ncbi:hypothetical protein GCM10020256_59280 [Streptomyces thermocoprophilus]